METQKHITCKSCGNNFEGTYCNTCGEKLVKPSDRTLLHFFSQLFEAFTFIDNKFFRTLKLLIIKPGFLTKENIEGRTVKYIKPLAFFLISNLLYFLINPVDIFNSTLTSQLKGQRYSSSVYPLYERIAQEKGFELTEGEINKRFEVLYNEKSSSVSKLTIFLLVFAFAIVLLMLNFYKKRLIYEHVVLALHFITFVIFLMLFLSSIIYIGKWLNLKLADADINSTSVLLPLVLVIVYYLSASIKRVYNDKWILAIPKGIIAFVGFFASIILYRYILFHLTIHSI